MENQTIGNAQAIKIPLTESMGSKYNNENIKENHSEKIAAPTETISLS